jgi:fido (protein-threonine AMPylation protein)
VFGQFSLFSFNYSSSLSLDSRFSEVLKTWRGQVLFLHPFQHGNNLSTEITAEFCAYSHCVALPLFSFHHG